MVLSPTDLALLRRLLRDHLAGYAVWAYGSRVTGAARPGSDLDLVALVPAAARRQVGALREALEESNLSVIVDLHVWDELPERFRQGIAARHLVLQAAGGGPVGARAEPPG